MSIRSMGIPAFCPCLGRSSTTIHPSNNTGLTSLLLTNFRLPTFVRFRNKNQTRTLMTSHIDMAPPYINYTYHSNGTITGRGTNDAKGCVAAQINSVEARLAESLIGEGDVAMLFVVAEETDGVGMIKKNDLGLT